MDLIFLPHNVGEFLWNVPSFKLTAVAADVILPHIIEAELKIDSEALCSNIFSERLE